MGLDVYLRRCDNLEAEIALQDQAEAFSNKLWEGKDYDKTSEAEKERIRAETKAEYERLGLDQYGSSTKIESIELDSVTNPEHMFKVGYLRSSYNSGGINSVLERAGVMDLYGIFQPAKEDYYVTIDWEGALVRVEQAIAAYRAHITDPMGRFDVMSIRTPIFDGVAEPADALTLFKGEMQKYLDRKQKEADPWSSYSNREGEFFLEGRKVFGFIPNSGWGKGFHVIVEKEMPENIEEEWYLQALLITKETIGYVLSRPVEEQKNYFLAWSG